jgi:hypothetical protein
MDETARVFGFVVEQVECFTFTVAHAVASAGWRVVVLADPSQNTSKQNAFYMQQLARLPAVTLETGFEPIDLELLCIELTRKTPRDRANYYSRRARRVEILTYCRRPTFLQTLMAQAMDARQCPRCVLRARRFIYVDGYRPIDLFAFLGSRRHLGIDVHSLFLLDPRLRELMFAADWEPQRKRPVRLNFIGTPSPDSRARMLHELEAILSRPGLSVTRTPDQAGDILWLNGVAVPMDQFCRFLTDSDYTLCPPGHIRLTHRVVEALVRGSIPILEKDELPLYELGLEPGKNCVAVPSGRWKETVAATLDTDQATAIGMRANILKMREKVLTADASNRRLCRQLGVNV